jgi:hypothetical protein
MQGEGKGGGQAYLLAVGHPLLLSQFPSTCSDTSDGKERTKGDREREREGEDERECSARPSIGKGALPAASLAARGAERREREESKAEG